MSSTILIERDGRTAVVTLNRPTAMNSLSRELRGELDRTILELDADDSVDVIILTGSGERAFCAGLDLKELGADASALGAANATTSAENPVLAVEQARKPVIGAINGVAITGGFELALACDVLIAATNARFADTHARVGIMPGWGLSQKLSRLIGVYRARQMSFTGNFIDASTALAWGLVGQVVAPEALLPAAKALAADMGTADQAMLRQYKALINEGFALSFGEGLALEHARSTAANANVSADEVEARRMAVIERGRSQQTAGNTIR
jgi:enoyl-CoA hydratase